MPYMLNGQALPAPYEYIRELETVDVELEMLDGSLGLDRLAAGTRNRHILRYRTLTEAQWATINTIRATVSGPVAFVDLDSNSYTVLWPQTQLQRREPVGGVVKDVEIVLRDQAPS